MLLSFASTTLTAVLLGTTEFGTWSAGLSLALLAAACVPLGTDRLLVRQLSVIELAEQQALEVALTHRISAVVGGLLLAISMTAAACCHFAGRHDWTMTLLIAAALLFPLTLTWLRQWAAIPLVGTRNAVLPEQVLIPAGTISVLAVLWLLAIKPSAQTAAGIFAGLSLIVWALSAFLGPLKPLYRMPPFTLLISPCHAIPFVHESPKVSTSCQWPSAQCSASALHHSWSLPVVDLRISHIFRTLSSSPESRPFRWESFHSTSFPSLLACTNPAIPQHSSSSSKMQPRVSC